MRVSEGKSVSLVWESKKRHFLVVFGLWDVCCPHFTSNKVCPFLLHGFVQKISESLVLVKVRFSDFWQSFIWDWIVQLNREKPYLQVLSWCALAKLEGVAPSLSKEAESKMTLTRTQRHVKIGIGLRSYMATASGLAPFCSRSLTNWSLPW